MTSKLAGSSPRARQKGLRLFHFRRWAGLQLATPPTPSLRLRLPLLLSHLEPSPFLCHDSIGKLPRGSSRREFRRKSTQPTKANLPLGTPLLAAFKANSFPVTLILKGSSHGRNRSRTHSTYYPQHAKTSIPAPAFRIHSSTMCRKSPQHDACAYASCRCRWVSKMPCVRTTGQAPKSLCCRNTTKNVRRVENITSSSCLPIPILPCTGCSSLPFSPVEPSRLLIPLQL